jgi:hypothetical protein
MLTLLDKDNPELSPLMWTDTMIPMLTMITVATKNLIARRISVVLEPFVKFGSVMKKSALSSELTAIVIDVVKSQEKAFCFSATGAAISSISKNSLVLKSIVVGKSVFSSLFGMFQVPFCSAIGIGFSKMRLFVIFPKILFGLFSPLSSVVANTPIASSSVPLRLRLLNPTLGPNFLNHGIYPLINVIRTIFDYNNKVKGKVQRPFRKEVGASVPKRIAPRTGDDMVCSAWRHAAA